jgi:cytochrome c-type biogenesis protein CcmH/NrfG
LTLVACGDLARTEPNPAAAKKIADARLAYETSPNELARVIALADAYYEGGRMIDAVDGYQKAVALGSKDPRVLGTLGSLYVKFGYLQSSVDQIRNCMESNREHPECFFALGSLFELDPNRQMQAQARRAFVTFTETAPPNHPKMALVRSKIDQLNARLGPDVPQQPQPGQGTADPHAQMGTQTPVQAQGPSDPHAGLPNGAKEDTDGVGELNPFGAALQRAFAAVQQNDAPGAEKAFREALAIQTDDATALSGLAQALLAQNKMVEGLAAAEQSLKADPKDPQSRYTLGMALLRVGRSAEDVKRGITLWEELVKDEPDYAAQMQVPAQLERIQRMMKQQNVHPEGR